MGQPCPLTASGVLSSRVTRESVHLIFYGQEIVTIVKQKALDYEA